VLFNLDKLAAKDSPQFDPAQAAQGATYVAPFASWRKTDDLTVQITAKRPDAVIPYQVANICMSGPANWKKQGRDWNKAALQPVGTGPWVLDRLAPRTRVELVRNAAYWDKERIPKSDRQILLPVPDANTRVAALLSDQVDWIEAPPPDAVDRLQASGMQVVTNKYPHIWPYLLNFGEGSAMRDIRVRKALNLAIDRDGLVGLLGGLAMPAKGMVYPGHPWFGKPAFDLVYDPAQAKALLAEAGYGPGKRLKITFAISTAGSGQMQPQAMNDFIQQNYAEVGVDLQFQVMEWEALRAKHRAGSATAENRTIDGLNNSWGFWDPDIGLVNAAWSPMKPPAGYNWGGYSDPVADALCQAENPMRKARLAALLAAAAATTAQAADDTLRIAMTATDIPTGKPATLRPGLATAWEQAPDDKKTWIFHLRPGVSVHDGTRLDADAVIWNFDRFFKSDSPQFEAPGSGLMRARVPTMGAYRKIDDSTVAITTKAPASYFPYQAVYILFTSPNSFEDRARLGPGRAAAGRRHRPFRIESVASRQSVTLARNDAYWDPAHKARVAKILLRSIPEANTRLAALRSGQVDWIEVPPPDGIDSLKQAGFTVTAGSYPHVWPWFYGLGEGSPLADVRVRQALNYCIDRLRREGGVQRRRVAGPAHREPTAARRARPARRRRAQRVLPPHRMSASWPATSPPPASPP